MSDEAHEGADRAAQAASVLRAEHRAELSRQADAIVDGLWKILQDTTEAITDEGELDMFRRSVYARLRGRIEDAENALTAQRFVQVSKALGWPM